MQLPNFNGFIRDISLFRFQQGQQKSSAPTNQIYAVPANQFSPSPGTTLKIVEAQQKIKIVRTSRQSNSRQSIFSLCQTKWEVICQIQLLLVIR